ncbi:TatD family hydrolase [Elusimicrobiota bacterium]
MTGSMGLFDSHAHLLDSRFKNDVENVIDGMDGIICVYSPGENESLFKTLLENNRIWGIAGIHPHDAKDYSSLSDKLKETIKMDKVMAVGEIGLDLYYNNSPKDRQVEVFEEQLSIAAEEKLPAVIHTRDAFKETMSILDGFKIDKILVHCFSGTGKQMEECLDKGYYIAIGGVVTFPKAQELKKIAAAVPLDKLLLETDCPYLAPQPVRGKRNEPSYLRYIAEEIAALKSVAPEYIAEMTFRNTVDFFGL